MLLMVYSNIINKMFIFEQDQTLFIFESKRHSFILIFLSEKFMFLIKVNLPKSNFKAIQDFPLIFKLKLPSRGELLHSSQY